MSGWTRMFLALLLGLIVTATAHGQIVFELGPPQPKGLLNHFPDRMHAFVWRN